MRHLLLFYCLLNSLSVLAQPYSYTPQHEYESFYLKYRREQYTTTLAQYELSGPVKEVRLLYSPAEKPAWNVADTQYLTFSKEGLLTRYMLNDTSYDAENWPGNYYAKTWHLYYNSVGDLDTIRVAKFDDYAEVYWCAYDSAGFLISAGEFDEDDDQILAVESLHYTWTSYDSCLSVTTDPFSEYDISGNVMGDTVHFAFDDFGRISKETVYYFWGLETISFLWKDDRSFRYSINGRSYMHEFGSWKINEAGQLLHSTTNGYRIDQRGTHHFDNEDSLVYNKQGWIIAEYHDRPPLYEHELSNEALIFTLGTPTPENKPAEPRLKLNRKYVYTTDAKGNWITRSHYDGSGKYLGKETRKITYY